MPPLALTLPMTSSKTSANGLTGAASLREEWTTLIYPSDFKYRKKERKNYCGNFVREGRIVEQVQLYTADRTSLARLIGKVAVYRISVNCTAALCFFLQLFFIFPPVLFFPTEIVILTSSLWPTLVVYWYTATLAH